MTSPSPLRGSRDPLSQPLPLCLCLQGGCRTTTTCGRGVWRSPWRCPAVSSRPPSSFLLSGQPIAELCWPSSGRCTWVSTCPSPRAQQGGVAPGSRLCLCAGVKGRVFDGSGLPVQNAVVEVKGRNNMSPFRSDRHGEYYRLLLPGNYSFRVNRAAASCLLGVRCPDPTFALGSPGVVPGSSHADGDR